MSSLIKVVSPTSFQEFILSSFWISKSYCSEIEIPRVRSPVFSICPGYNMRAHIYMCANRRVLTRCDRVHSGAPLLDILTSGSTRSEREGVRERERESGFS